MPGQNEPLPASVPFDKAFGVPNPQLAEIENEARRLKAELVAEDEQDITEDEARARFGDTLLCGCPVQIVRDEGHQEGCTRQRLAATDYINGHDGF